MGNLFLKYVNRLEITLVVEGYCLKLVSEQKQLAVHVPDTADPGHISAPVVGRPERHNHGINE